MHHRDSIPASSIALSPRTIAAVRSGDTFARASEVPTFGFARLSVDESLAGLGIADLLRPDRLEGLVHSKEVELESTRLLT